MDFKDIVGHENIISNMKRAIENDKVNHSYLFEGPEAVGKKKFALALAKTLLCKEGGLEPCNKCSSCIKFESGNHPDMYLIKPEKDVIKKEQVEEAIRSMITKPLESRRKIYIVDDSYKMTKEAQNGFLKTLEEPPAYVNMILISRSSGSILPTILSRCEVIKFFPIEKAKIIDFLMKKYGKTREEADFISSFSKGSIGKAIDLSLSEDFAQMRDDTIEIVDNVLNGDKLKVFASMTFFDENEDNIEEILDIILYWFRDLLIYKETGLEELLINKDKVGLLSSETFLTKGKINVIIETVQSTKDNLSRRVNYQLSLETMLLKIQEV